METEFERRRELTRKFRLDRGRDPDDVEWLEIYAAAKMGRTKTWGWS